MAPIIVYQIGSLGDTIVSIPAYRAIRRHFANRTIKLLEAELQEGRVHPSQMLIRENLIDGTIRYPHTVKAGSKLGLLQVWKEVFKAHPEAMVYIGPAERPPHIVERDKKFFRSTGVKNLIGFHGVDYTKYLGRDASGNLPKMPHQAELRLERLAEDGVQVHAEDLETPLLHPTMEEREQALDWLAARRKHPGRKLLMMGISTAQPATRWPTENFQELGERITKGGLAEIVIVGGKAEAEMGERLTNFWGEGMVAAGQFGVFEMAALLSHADLYVGLDTGTTHMASAVNAPIVALYSDHHQPGEWDPLGRGHTVIMHRVPCQGCHLVTCNVPGHPCMTGITVEEVVQAVQSRLG